MVHEAEGGEGQALDHDLHAEVGHVPAAVGDDVVEQHAEVGVERVVPVHLGVEVIGEHLDVAGLVHHLGGGVVLGVDPRHNSEGHTSELKSLMRISYAVSCLKKKKNTTQQ